MIFPFWPCCLPYRIVTCSPMEKRVINTSPGQRYLLLISHSGPAFFVSLPATHHDFFRSDDAPPTKHGRERRPSFQNGLVTPADTKTASVTAARKLFAPLFTGSSLVDGERTPVNFLTVQGVNGRLCLLIIVHLNKAEAFRAARISVLDDLGRLN